jgi:hypothetical protein
MADEARGAMSMDLRLVGRPTGMHPAVRSRVARDAAVTTLIALLPLAAGLAITTALPHPNALLLFGGVAGIIAFAYLLTSTRSGMTVAVLLVYLGVFDGPVKLMSASSLASGVRDVLILAVVLGMLMRLFSSHQRITIPPLAWWVLAFVAFVVIDAANPKTLSFLKVLGGFRQQLEWVPFFFFGYMLMRDKERFRKLYLLIGVIALLNGLAGAVESRMSLGQVASLGPGYHQLVYGGEGQNGITGRTYAAEGVAHLRPPALGSDAGFGGSLGALALPLLLALLATGGPPRRQAFVLLLAGGAVLGVASSASRTATVIAVLSLVLFAVVSVIGGVRISRALTGLLATFAIVFVVAAALTAYSGSGVLARQSHLTNVQATNEHGGAGKAEALSEMPRYLIAEPFGFGLGISAAVSGFGGRAHTRFEGERLSAGGSAYELLMKEVGAPGLLLWVGLTINALVLALTGLRRIADIELRTLLAGLVASFLAVTLEGLSGPTLAVTPGAFLWFSIGVIAFWFGGGRAAVASSRASSAVAPSPAPQVAI